MRVTKINKRPLLIFNGTKDITEADIARQKYYQLMHEQAVWNATRPATKKILFGLFKVSAQ